MAGLGEAGERLARQTAPLSAAEQADGFRALVRALHNQLARFEVDRERPELVPFNGWRQKFFMDDPDFLYWVAEIRSDRRYRVRGTRGDAAFVSLTAYAASGLATAEALDDDSLRFDAQGRLTVTVGGERPASGDWLRLPEGASCPRSACSPWAPTPATGASRPPRASTATPPGWPGDVRRRLPPLPRHAPDAEQ